MANDHPVRKLISRFRKISDARTTNPAGDVERGVRHPSAPGTPNATKVINVSESPTQMNSVPKLGGGAAKWGKIMGGGGAAGGKTDTVTPIGNNGKKEQDTPKATETLNNAPESSPETPKAPAKPISRWGKMFAKQPDTIEESPETLEGESKNSLKKAESTDSGILRSNVKLDQIGSDDGDSGNKRDIANSITLTTVEKHMLTSLYDIRLEIKEDMETLGQKMNRIDEQVGELLRMFSPASSPGSSRISTYPNSRYSSSGNSTNNNSVSHSPRTSQPTSPHHSSTDNLPNTEIPNGRSKPARQESSDLQPPSSSNGSSKVSTPSRGSFSSKLSSISHNSTSSDAAAAGNKQKPNLEKPTIPKRPTDIKKSPEASKDDDIPVKDRDLDIL